ncbi:MAG TPA: TadE/TadG family type IV pilus assembly protein [Negativicutes bacterium]|jgi:Flp pilus assembly protein TadG
MKQIAKQQGQAAVEFAIVAPLFFFIVCIIMVFGIFFFDYLSVNEIAQELARTIAVSSTDTTLITRINARLAGMNHVQVWINVPSNNVTVTTNVTTLMGPMTNVSPNNVHVAAVAANGDIQVTVTADPRFTIPFIANIVPATISSGPVVMRIES